MALDFEWTGKGWIARKVRRKLAWYEHRGAEYYVRERLRKPLPPIVHPSSFEGYSAPPSWAEIPNSWSEWETVSAGHFYSGGPAADGESLDDLDSPPIAQTPQYTLERCHVATVCSYQVWNHAGPSWERRPVLYRWELNFADAMFRFVSRAIAEAALPQLLKIRKAKHPRPRFAKHSAENAAVYFTSRRLQKLPQDSLPAIHPADIIPRDTAA